MRFAELEQAFDQQVAGWKPDRPAPVGVPALELDFFLGRFIAHAAVAERERMLFMVFGQTADAVIGQKLIRALETLQNSRELLLVDNRENVRVGSADGCAGTGVTHQFLPVGNEPVEVAHESRLGLEVRIEQDLYSK